VDLPVATQSETSDTVSTTLVFCHSHPTKRILCLCWEDFAYYSCSANSLWWNDARSL